MTLLEQISSAQSKNELETALQANEQLTQDDLDVLKNDLSNQVGDTKDQLRDFMNDIYYKIVNKEDHTYKQDTEQDLDALKTLAKIQLYGNYKGTHDTSPDLVWGKRTTATLREIYKEKNGIDPKDQEYKTEEKVNNYKGDSDRYKYKVEDNQIVVDGNSIDLADKDGKRNDFIDINGTKYRNKDTFDATKPYTGPGYEINNDGVYYGDYKDGVIHGAGTMIYTNGDSYVGKRDMMEIKGRGTYHRADGSKYEGLMSDGEMQDDDGVYTNIHGVLFKGKWEGGSYKQNGQSLDKISLDQVESMKTQAINTIKQTQKLVEETTQKLLDQREQEKINIDPNKIEISDTKIAIGSTQYPIINGYLHIGDEAYKNCTDLDEIYKGPGFIKYKDGSLYYGEVENNKPQGKGTKIRANGDKYIGNMHDGIISGDGKMTWKDGSSYEGPRKSGKMEGKKGTYTNINGVTYKGKWKDNKYMEDDKIRSKTDLDQYRYKKNNPTSNNHKPKDDRYNMFTGKI